MKTVLLLLLLSPAGLWAQSIQITPQDLQNRHAYLLLRDGSVVRGQIVRQDSSLITVRKRNGDLTFVEAEQVIRVAATPIAPLKDPSYTIFVLKDSARIEGTYVGRDQSVITIRKRNGQLTYFEPELLARVDTVRWQTEWSGRLATGSYFPNRFSPWLLTGQTAYVPEKGRFYFRNTALLLNEFDYGITRHWSVGTNFIVVVPYVVLAGDALFQYDVRNTVRFFSKFSVPLGRYVRLGTNVTYKPKNTNDVYNQGIWTFQALASLGTTQQNVTVGYGLVDRGSQRMYQYWASTYPTPFVTVGVPNQSFLTLGIMQKVSPFLTLISDNQVNLGQRYYSYNDDNYERARMSFALRIDRRRHAFDLGIYSFIYRKDHLWDGKRVRVFPYLSYNLILGKK